MDKERGVHREAVGALERRIAAARAAAEEEVRRVTEDVNARLLQARDAMAALRQAADAASQRAESATQENERLQRQLRTAQADVAEKEGLVASLRADIDRLTREKSAEITAASEREQDLRSHYGAQITALSGELAALRLEAQAARDGERAAASQASSASNEVRVKDTMLADQNETIRGLKASLSSARADWEERERELRDVVSSLQGQLEEAQRHCDALAVARDEAVAEADRATSAAASARKVAAKLEGMVADLRAGAAGADDLRRELAAKETALSFVEREVAQIKEGYDRRIAAAQQAAADARTRAEAAEKAAADKGAQVDAQAARLAALQQQLAAAEEEGRKHHAAATTAEARAAATEGEMRVLLRELDACKARAKQQARAMAALALQSVGEDVDEGTGSGTGTGSGGQTGWALLHHFGAAQAANTSGADSPHRATPVHAPVSGGATSAKGTTGGSLGVPVYMAPSSLSPLVSSSAAGSLSTLNTAVPAKGIALPSTGSAASSTGRVLPATATATGTPSASASLATSAGL